MTTFDRTEFIYYMGYSCSLLDYKMASNVADFVGRLISHPKADWFGSSHATRALNEWLERPIDPLAAPLAGSLSRFDSMDESMTSEEITHEIKTFFAEYLIEKRHRTEVEETCRSFTEGNSSEARKTI